MDIKLEIYWGGTAPGLAEHRLSLGAFGKALDLLLATYRRIASGLLTNALEDPTYGTSGGKYAKQAERLDLELEALKEGSTGVELRCTSRFATGENLDFFADLPLQAGKALLEYIDAEANAVPRYVGARKYLKALPEGVTSQSYRLWRNGTCEREVSIGVFKVLDLPAAAPHLELFRGFVVGVGFEPGRPEIRFKNRETGRQLTCTATNEQVSTALEMRDVEVDALTVTGEKHRLLRVTPSDSPYRPCPRDARTEMLFDRWGELLRRLAQ